jgi:ABC-type uncharacterized transport system ATPase subunit
MKEYIVTDMLNNPTRLKAVQDLDLAVHTGEIFGFFGAQRRRQNHHLRS